MENELMCNTKYPIYLVHGVGYRDNIPLIRYWGRIPETLRRHGASVFTSQIESWAPCELNAGLQQREIESFLAGQKAEKVNIIAHSKGGLDSRYLISALKFGARIASLTTISTPHAGSYLADFVSKHFHSMEKVYTRIINLFAKILGDSSPDSRKVLLQLTQRDMQEFNREITNDPSVYYQSYGSMLKNGFDDPVFYPTYRILYGKEGANDGLVSVESSKWGDFKGVIAGKKHGKGISHREITDFKRRPISGTDIPGVYIRIVHQLNENGY